MQKINLIIKLPTIFDETFKDTSVPFLIPDFNSLSCELDSFMCYITCYILNVILSHFIIKQKIKLEYFHSSL